MSAAQAALAQRIASGAVKIWVPVRLPDTPVIPMFGGDPATDWVDAVSVLLRLAQRTGLRTRVVDLTEAGTMLQLHDRLRTKFPGHYATEAIGIGGTVDPLDGTDASVASALLADVFRAEDDRTGRNVAAMYRNLLGQLVGCLDQSVPLDVRRLLAAVEFAQFASTGHAGALAAPEQDALLQTVHARLQHSRPLSDGMFELGNLVTAIGDFAPAGAPTIRPGDARHGTVSVTSVAGPAGSARELAADLVAARAADALRRRKCDVVVVLGADGIPPRSLDAIADGAQQAGARLVTFFERLTDGSSDRLGWRSSTVAGFFRLGNARDAALAADFLGKRHRFVLSGVSETSGESFEWGWSTGTTTGTDRSTSRSWQLGRSFDRTTSSSVTRSNSSTRTRSQGQSTSQSTSTSYERVYEHLVDPSVFQQLDSGAVLLVDVQTSSARLASCHRDVARSRLVDWSSVLAIGE